MTRRKKYTLFIIVLVLGLALDQFTKWIAVQHFVIERNPVTGYATHVEEDIMVAGRLFRFTFAENDGAFLSLGSNLPDGVRLILLTILPGLLLIAVMVYMVRSDKLGMAENVAFSLIAAGGLGNIIDRIMAGKVVDFMHMDFGLFQTGVFNVADLYIMAGIGVYLVAAFRKNRVEAKATAAAEAQGTASATTSANSRNTSSVDTSNNDNSSPKNLPPQDISRTEVPNFDRSSKDLLSVDPPSEDDPNASSFDAEAPPK